MMVIGDDDGNGVHDYGDDDGDDNNGDEDYDGDDGDDDGDEDYDDVGIYPGGHAGVCLEDNWSTPDDQDDTGI